jgi:zinc protease
LPQNLLKKHPQFADAGLYTSHEGTNISVSRLENGLDVVVIPDRRAPVVTHMLWYRNGSCDDPIGKSGIAHFLEHLMFKGTTAYPHDTFTQAVADIGGSQNAFTSLDYTCYYQRVAPMYLATMMQMEADRMQNLVLDDAEVLTERGVVTEERRMSTDSDPASQLDEAMTAALFTRHPYGIPVIGFMHEIETLTREDALAYYRRFYVPNNALLVVAGDVDPEAALQLARQYYGVLIPSAQTPVRQRPIEPPSKAIRQITLADEKVEQPALSRYYRAPVERNADLRQARALEVLDYILSAGSTGRLYRALVMDNGPATAVGSSYFARNYEEYMFSVSADPKLDVSLAQLEAQLDLQLKIFTQELVSKEELKRAQSQIVTRKILQQDSQFSLAYTYGAALTNGLSLNSVLDYAKDIEAVTAKDVRAAAQAVFFESGAVTGYLLKK